MGTPIDQVRGLVPASPAEVLICLHSSLVSGMTLWVEVTGLEALGPRVREGEASWRETRARLQAALDGYRAIMSLTYVEGHST